MREREVKEMIEDIDVQAGRRLQAAREKKKRRGKDKMSGRKRKQVRRERAEAPPTSFSPSLASQQVRPSLGAICMSRLQRQIIKNGMPGHGRGACGIYAIQMAVLLCFAMFWQTVRV